MANDLVKYESDTTQKALVITLSDGKQETYFMTKVPDATTTLVLAAKQDVLADLNLESVLTNLDRAVDLMYVAYCGVAGTGAIQASVSDRQKTLMDLCGECVTVMTAFKTTTGDIIARVLEAFQWLLQAKEARAMDVLSRCSNLAKTMADKSEELAKQFKDLSDATQKDSDATLVAQGAEVEKLKKLKQQRDEMQATLTEQTTLSSELANNLADIQRLYDEAKATEAKESERAFISTIVSACTSAIGAGVGAYVAAKNPIGTAVSNLSKQPTSNPPNQHSAPTEAMGDTATSNDPSNNDAGTPKPTADAATSKFIAEKNTAVITAKKDLDAATAAVEAANKEVEAKKTAKDEALKSGDSTKLAEAETALTQAEDNLKQYQSKKAEAEDAQRAAEKALKHAQDNKAASSGVAAAMNNVADSTKKMAEDAAKAADSIHVEKMKLLDQKLQLEKQKRDALAQVAKLTESLKFTDETKSIEEEALKALEIAIWAFANISTSLSTAKLFWNNMATYCTRLASSDIQDKIQDEVKYADPPEERIKYYLSDMFMPTAVFYLARWKALQTVCEEYVDASNKARDKSVQNINKAPTIEQARTQLQGLKDQIAHQLDLDSLKSQKRSQAVMDELKLLIPGN